MKYGPSVRQKGVFTIISTLAAVAVLLFVGMVVDAGRMMVVHAEMQNAADACALAAAAELNNSTDGTAPSRAALVGRQLVLNWYRQNFQSEAIQSAEVDIQFSSAINGTYTAAGSANARVAQCTLTHPGLNSVLMKLADITTLLPHAVARAGLVPGAKVCALPLALDANLVANLVLNPKGRQLTMLKLAEHSGNTPSSNRSPYIDQIMNESACMVSTAKHLIGISDLSASTTTCTCGSPCTDIVAALNARYTCDPELHASPGTTPRRVIAVPTYDSSNKYTARNWACLELKGAGTFDFLGYSNDGNTFVPPAATKPWCIASGLPLGIDKSGTVNYPTGPFVPALLQ